MPFASAVSRLTNTGHAVEEACSQVASQLGRPADICFLFASHDHRERFPHLGREVMESLAPATLLGCCGESIIAGGCEYEREPALSLWAAALPGAEITPFHLAYERTSEGGAVNGWPENMPETWPGDSIVLMFGEPFSFPTDWLLERLNADQPGVPVLGGNASGGGAPGDHMLWWNNRALPEGAVGAMLRGEGVQVRNVVSQGCRPIGRPWVITKAEGQAILELGGKPVLLQLHELLESLPVEDRGLLRHGLHLGRVVDEYRESFRAGDFLIRNVLGMDRDAGSLVIGDFFRPGQTVQFHLRDAASASDDLDELLAAAAAAGPVEAALLFSCNGRGTRLFPNPHHDAEAITRTLGEIPLAGFFAAGEMGPIGGKNFLHGMTASIALFGA